MVSRWGSLRGQAALLGALSAFAAVAAAQGPQVGHLAPDFALISLRGDSVRLSQFRGHPVVVKFWATWCSTCRTEMPELLAARDSNRTTGLVVLTIDSDDRRIAHIRSFLATLTGVADLPVLIDPDGRVQARYRIPLLPTTVFIDTAGVVRVFDKGAIRQSELLAGLRSILPHQE